VAGAVALIAAPTAYAEKPVRTVISPLPPISIPAGLGCSFPISGEPDPRARQTILEFSNGETRILGHANATLTNLDSGASILWRSRYRQTANSGTGRFFFLFFPGDQGPFGLVGEPGALLGLIGHFELTADPDTGVITSFTLNGQATDLCAVLSA
jgi:hypothetical protein